MKYLILILPFLVSCASQPEKDSGADIGVRMEEKAYLELIEKNTRSDKQYKGLYQTFEVHATIVNSDVQGALLQKMSDTLQWDERTARKEREKLFRDLGAKSQVVVSLYTPNHKHNDLHKGASIWKVYLEHEGKRYQGQAASEAMQLVQLKSLYPYHTRWSKAYKVTFNVPMSVIENDESILILTSTLGKTELKFKPVPL